MRLSRSLLMLAVLAAGTTGQARGQAAPSEYSGLETGKMWTFDAPPLEYWARRYTFRPTQEWLDHVRLSSLRQPGCTASFVSPDGLVMTNHHCARSCIVSATRPGEDLLENGFYARTRNEERPCEGMYVDQLLSISDVTDSVNAAVTAAVPAAATEQRQATVQRLQQRCTGGAPDLVCQVISMYRGGQYKLYRFRRFRDVRLVFAPEGQVAFFGGDPDNFTYPRHAFDVTFYRAWSGGEPVRTEHLRWSRTGARENDLVFVVGNPGSTGRLNTIAQLEYLRDTQYPAQLAQLARQRDVYLEVGRLNPARGSELRNTVFSLENSLKAVGGYQSGLLDPQLMTRKRDWETAFRSRVNAAADLRRQYGDAWTSIQTTRRAVAALDARRRYHSFGAWGAQLLNLAGLIVRHPAETTRPDSERLPQFRDAARAGFARAIDSTVIDTLLEIRMLAAYLGAMQADLPAADPVLRAALAGRGPEQAARAMVTGSRLLEGARRRALIEGGQAALNASDDPFIALARIIDPLERALAVRFADLIAQEARHDERIARALLAVFGGTVAPDATFSLRISDGEVRRYPWNGSLAQPFTTLHGLYDRHFGFAGQAPWNLPRRWVERRDSLNLATQWNAVSTNDIIGGNSGSAVISRDGEVVGLIFDGNIEGLPARFLFTEARGRSVWVDSRGILEALRRVYDAGALAAELAGER